MLEIVKHHSSYSVSDKNTYFESNSYQKVEDFKFQLECKRSHRRLLLLCQLKGMREIFEKGRQWAKWEVYNNRVQRMIADKSYSIDFLIK
jgi:hypothetical protein